MAIGLLATARTAPAGPVPSAVQTAEYTTAADNSAVKPVSYTAGASGHQLKWLPYRPAKTVGKPMAKSQAITADERTVSMAAALDPVESAPPASNALSDPFGDGSAAATAPPALANSNAQQTAQPTPSPSDLMQGPLEPPAAAAAPPVTAAQPQPGAEVQPSEIPSLEQELAVAPQMKPQECTSPKDLKPIRQISYKIAPEPGEFPKECTLGNEQFVPRSWPCVTFAWKASALCHKPLYFEEVHSERYGHSWGPGLQPFISAGHFFLTIPALPYLMGVYPPTECIYPLGYYRPGDCAPYLLDPIPLSVRGALFEGGVATGLAFLIP